MTDKPYCGLVATCGRWAGHTGHHGGFRPVPVIRDQDGPLEPPGFHRLGLAPREVEILLLMAEGLTAKESANRLGISSQTIKNHLSNAYRKLDVTGLVGALRAMGWIRITPAEGELRVAEADLIRDVDDVLVALAGVTGRLDEARDWLVARQQADERRETA